MLSFDWWRHDKSNNSEILNIQSQQVLVTKGNSDVSYFVHESEMEVSSHSEESSVCLIVKTHNTFMSKYSQILTLFWKNVCLKNLNRIKFGHLSVNSIRNKFNSLVQIINNSVDVLLYRQHSFSLGYLIPYMPEITSWWDTSLYERWYTLI